MLVNHNIKNFFGGVSQQKDEYRFDNQVESMENCLITEAQGLRRRNPTEWLRSVGAFLGDDKVVSHSYDRGDGLEKYGIIFDEVNGLRVYDSDGTQKTVNKLTYASIDVDNYLAGFDSVKDIKFLTVGDTTWILNTKKVVNSSTTAGGYSPYDVFYWIKRTFNDGLATPTGYTYEVRNAPPFNTLIATSNAIDSIAVASALASTLNAIVGTTSVAVGSILGTTSSLAQPFSGTDSWGNQASYLWNTADGVAKLSDLPPSMAGFTTTQVGAIPISGSNDKLSAGYYLKWEDNKWKETSRNADEEVLDTDCMPLKLVRQSDGTFSLGFNSTEGASGHDGFETEWGKRVVGDDESNPLPTFIDGRITDMFFHKNRLGFASGENIILSETGSYYNFFRTSVIELLDSDPIDVSVDSNTVSIIRNINTFAGGLLIWSDNEQFLLKGGEILSPSTASISYLSSFSADSSIEPIAVDDSIVFFQKKGSYLDVLLYSIASIQSDNTTSASIASHAPEYIPSTIKAVKVSSRHNMIFLLDSVENENLYVYKYHVESNERVISAWHKWTFSGLAIASIEIIDGVLFIINTNGNILSIELDPILIDSVFQDGVSELGTYDYDSSIVMSKYNVELKDGLKDFREPFYVKTVELSKDGDVNLDIINSERATTKTVDTKYTERRLFIGGNSEKVRLGLSSKGTAGFQVDAVSIEGEYNPRSKNI